MSSPLSRDSLGFTLAPGIAKLAEGNFFKFLFEELVDEVENKETLEALFSTEEGKDHLIFLMSGFAKEKISNYNALHPGERRASMRGHLVAYLKKNPLKKDFYKDVYYG